MHSSKKKKKSEEDEDDEVDQEKLSILLSMGFEVKKIKKVLSDSKNNLDDSIALLLRYIFFFLGIFFFSFMD